MRTTKLKLNIINETVTKSKRLWEKKRSIKNHHLKVDGKEISK
jgi:hypothetical protein